MSSTEERWGTDPNAEATAAWDGPLFERFVQYRRVFADGLGAHGEVALALVPPQPGQRVLDIGCGFGDTTQRIAGLVGPTGEVVGVDVAPRFIEAATTEAGAAGARNVSFAVRDVQTDDLGEGFDMAFSRMGTMFFANPVAAMRNVRKAIAPGGRLVMVVWRRREDNDWLYRAQQIVEPLVLRNEQSDEPTCGPGPFSMSGADTTSDILLHSGFTNIAFARSDIPIRIGDDVEEAIGAVTAVGPAAELLRLAGDEATPLRQEIDARLRDGLAEFAGENGLWASASTWIVSATA